MGIDILSLSQLIIDSCFYSDSMSSDSYFSDAADSKMRRMKVLLMMKTNKNGMKVIGKDLVWVQVC